MRETRTVGPQDDLSTAPQWRQVRPGSGWAHVNRASSIPSPSCAFPPEQPVVDRSGARGVAGRPDSSEHQTYRLSIYRDLAGGPQRRHKRRRALRVRAWSVDFADTDGPSHHPSHPRPDGPTTAGALPLHLNHVGVQLRIPTPVRPVLKRRANQAAGGHLLCRVPVTLVPAQPG